LTSTTTNESLQQSVSAAAAAAGKNSTSAAGFNPQSTSILTRVPGPVNNDIESFAGGSSSTTAQTQTFRSNVAYIPPSPSRLKSQSLHRDTSGTDGSESRPTQFESRSSGFNEALSSGQQSLMARSSNVVGGVGTSLRIEQDLAMREVPIPGGNISSTHVSRVLSMGGVHPAAGVPTARVPPWRTVSSLNGQQLVLSNNSSQNTSVSLTNHGGLSMIKDNNGLREVKQIKSSAPVFIHGPEEPVKVHDKCLSTGLIGELN